MLPLLSGRTKVLQSHRRHLRLAPTRARCRNTSLDSQEVRASQRRLMPPTTTRKQQRCLRKGRGSVWLLLLSKWEGWACLDRAAASCLRPPAAGVVLTRAAPGRSPCPAGASPWHLRESAMRRRRQVARMHVHSSSVPQTNDRRLTALLWRAVERNCRPHPRCSACSRPPQALCAGAPFSPVSCG